MLSLDLPEAICMDELLEVLGGYRVKLFHQAQYPDNFLGLLTAKSIEKLLNWAIAGLSPVKADLTHPGRLTQT